WTGGGGANNTWSNAANWSTSSPGGIPASGDDLVFPNLTSSTVNLTTNNNISNLQIKSITLADPQGYTLAGNQITLGVGTNVNSLIIAASSQNNVISFDIKMGSTAGNS